MRTHRAIQRGQAPRRDEQRSEGGIAIVIVLISIFVLTMLAGGLAYSMKIETRLARNANSEAEIEWLGRSALEKARYMIYETKKLGPKEPYDGLNQVWAGGPGGAGTSNSPLANMTRTVDTPTGHADFTIEDCERKVNINIANELVLQQALTVAGLDAGETTPLVNSILDWVDPDDKPRIQGAESEVYQSYWSCHPYSAKNGPIDDLSELLFVKGVTPDLFFGGESTNFQGYALNPRSQKNGAPISLLGLTNLFTTTSSGKININTASAEVLQIIPGVTPEMAEGIVSARSGEAEAGDPMPVTGPYLNVDQVRRVPEVNLMAAQAIRQFCDVHSTAYEVHIDAQTSGYHRHFVGLLGASPRGVEILRFYWVD